MDDLSSLLSQEQASQAAGIGMEQSVANAQLTDLQALLDAVSPGTQLTQAAGNTGSDLLSYAGQESAAANQELTAANSSLGSLAAAAGYGTPATSTTTTTASPPASTIASLNTNPFATTPDPYATSAATGGYGSF